MWFKVDIENQIPENYGVIGLMMEAKHIKNEIKRLSVQQRMFEK
jgi:hypothetical protein